MSNGYGPMQFLTEHEDAPYLASSDCPLIIDRMSTLIESGAGFAGLIEKFASSHSLAYTSSLAVVLCRYARDHRHEPFTLLSKFYDRLRFRHHPGTMTGLLSTVDYCLAVREVDSADRNFVARLCDGALEMCELDLSSGRETRAQSTLESVEALFEQVFRADSCEGLDKRIARVWQMLERCGISRETAG
jgi:hypothetical protein